MTAAPTLPAGSDRVRLPNGSTGRLILDRGYLAIVFGRPAVTVFDQFGAQLVEPVGPDAREKLLARLKAACAAARPVEPDLPPFFAVIARARELCAWADELEACERRGVELRALLEGAR